MKKEYTAQSVFGNHCIFVGVLAFATGILLTLFASANPPSFVHQRTRDVGDQFDYSNGAPSDPAGSVYEAWVAHYNGPGDDGDDVVAMAADESGNVYVTGVGFGLSNRLGFCDRQVQLGRGTTVGCPIQRTGQ